MSPPRPPGASTVEAADGPGPGTVTHRCFVGLGARRSAAAREVVRLVLRCLAEADLAPATVVALVTVHGKRGQHGLLAAAEAVGAPVWAYPAARLAAVRVPCPSPTVASAVGTPSVAEAAALLAAGAGGRLLVAKRSSVPERPGPAAATCAIAVPPAG